MKNKSANAMSITLILLFFFTVTLFCGCSKKQILSNIKNCFHKTIGRLKGNKKAKVELRVNKPSPKLWYKNIRNNNEGKYKRR